MDFFHCILRRKFKTINDKHFIIVFVLSVFVVCLIRCIHGIDMTDSGFLLTGYQQIFKNPDSVNALFGLYDTLLIGGVWECFFGKLGIIGYKFLSAIFIVAICLLVYILLNKFVNRWIILLGSILLIFTGRFLVFHYDLASAFFSVLTIFLICQSLSKENVWYIFCAGFVLAISVFIRFPNVVQVGFILILFPFYIITRNIRETFRFLLFASIGFIAGICFNVYMAFSLGHTKPLFDMFNGLILTLSTPNDGHGFQTLLHGYKTSYLHVLKTMYMIAFYLYIGLLLYTKETYKWLKIVTLLLVNILFAYVLYISYGLVLIHACCCMVFIYVFARRNLYSHDFLYLIVLSFLMMLFLPMGSDGGLYNIGINCLFLSFPLALGIVWGELKNIDTVYNKALSVLILVLICVLTVKQSYKSMHDSYRDAGSVLRKTSYIMHSTSFAGFTNPSKAAMLDDLICSIRPYITTETELLAYPSIPMINYLTYTKPYLNNPWIGVMSLSNYEIMLQKSQKTKHLPIIVIAKAPDIYWFVPNSNWKSIADCEDWHPSIKEKNSLLLNFIVDHKYTILYDNEIFRVYIPSGED